MPTSSYPVLPYNQGDLVVHVQSFHGSTPARSKSYHSYSIIAPAKVAAPYPLPWIEEPNATIRRGIEGMRVSALCVIAKTTCKPEVLFMIGPALRGWNDMLDFKNM